MTEPRRASSPLRRATRAWWSCCSRAEPTRTRRRRMTEPRRAASPLWNGHAGVVELLLARRRRPEQGEDGWRIHAVLRRGSEWPRGRGGAAARARSRPEQGERMTETPCVAAQGPRGRGGAAARAEPTRTRRRRMTEPAVLHRRSGWPRGRGGAAAARGADPNKAKTDDGSTPCFIAAQNGPRGRGGAAARARSRPEQGEDE